MTVWFSPDEAQTRAKQPCDLHTIIETGICRPAVHDRPSDSNRRSNPQSDAEDCVERVLCIAFCCPILLTLNKTGPPFLKHTFPLRVPGHLGTGDADSLTGIAPEEERLSSSLDASDPLRAAEAEDMVAERMLRSARGRRGGDVEGRTTHVPSSLAEAQMAAAQLAARNSALQAQLRDRRRMYLRLQVSQPGGLRGRRSGAWVLQARTRVCACACWCELGAVDMAKGSGEVVAAEIVITWCLYSLQRTRSQPGRFTI